MKLNKFGIKFLKKEKGGLNRFFGQGIKNNFAKGDQTGWINHGLTVISIFILIISFIYSILLI